MRLSKKLLYCAVILCSFFLLTSCSSHPRTTKHSGPSRTISQQQSAGQAGQTTSPSLAIRSLGAVQPSDDVDDVEAPLAEPEESVAEEIADLDQLWRTEEVPVRIKTQTRKRTRTPIRVEVEEEEDGYPISGCDFPVVINQKVKYYLDLFTGKQRSMFARWLERSGRYVPEIEKKLKAAGLPKDLAYLAMIESGYNPSAVSRAGAGGLWQFMPATGRDYDLAINSWVDERREPQKATRAAIRYLSKLYRQFDDWHLAVAAYNTGEGNMERAIRRKGTSDFWTLAANGALYKETRHYVPKFIAAVIIARNPKAYGFHRISYEKQTRYEVVQVPGSTDLNLVAETIGTPLKQLQFLNNELLHKRTPPDQRYALRVPMGSRKRVLANINKLQYRPKPPPVVAPASEEGESSYASTTHFVKPGETLHSISRDYQVSLTDLLRVNRLRVSGLQAGQRLRIPGTASSLVAQNAAETQLTQTAALTPVVPAREKQLAQATAQLAPVAPAPGKQLAQAAAQLTPVAPVPEKQLAQATAQLAPVAPAPEKQLAQAAAQLAPVAPVQERQLAQAEPDETPVVQEARQMPKASNTRTFKLAKTYKPAESSKPRTPEKTVRPDKNANAKNAKLAESSKPKTPEKTVRPDKNANTKATAYQVQRGDTLRDIARKHGVSMAQLKQWNDLDRTGMVKTGQKLVLSKEQAKPQRTAPEASRASKPIQPQTKQLAQNRPVKNSAVAPARKSAEPTRTEPAKTKSIAKTLPPAAKGVNRQLAAPAKSAPGKQLAANVKVSAKAKAPAPVAAPDKKQLASGKKAVVRRKG